MNEEELRKILMGILAGLTVASLIWGANTCCDLDLGKVIMQEITKISGQFETTATTTLATLSGQVGIATTTLSRTLTVSGDVLISGGIIEGANLEQLRLGVNNDLVEVLRGGAGPYVVCDSSGNCAGDYSYAAATGTQNYLAKFTATSTLATSVVYELNEKIGIGTTTPAYTLDVNGDLRVIATATVAAFTMPTGAQEGYVLTSNASGVGTWQAIAGGLWTDAGTFIYPSTTTWDIVMGSNATTSAPFWFDVSSATLFSTSTLTFQTFNNDIILVPSSNVGIGTTTPAFKLTVAGDFYVSATSTLIGQTFFGGTTYYIDSSGAANLYSLTLSTPLSVSSGGTGTSSIPSGALLYGSGGSTLNILSIGTSGQILASNGSAPYWSTPSSLNIPTGTGQVNYIAKWTGTNTLSTSTITDDGTLVTVSNQFKTTATTTLAVNGGYVGIGTATPAYLFDVYTTGNTTIRLGASSTDTVLIGGGEGKLTAGVIDPWLIYNTSPTSTLYIRTASTTGADDIVFQTSGANTKLTILENGNVGIGTTAPGFKLQVAGTIGPSSFGYLTPPSGLSVSTTTGGNWSATGTYYYVVTALDPNNLSSAKSTEVSCTISATSEACVISWNSVSGATKYRVWRGTSSGGENQYFETTTTSYTDTGTTGTSGTPPSAPTSAYLAGNVGIGTTIPAYTLDVNGTLRSVSTSYLGTNNANVYIGGASAAGTGDLYLADQLIDWDNTSYYLDLNNTDISALFAGKVGIGTVSPTAKLYIKGENAPSGSDAPLALYIIGGTGAATTGVQAYQGGSIEIYGGAGGTGNGTFSIGGQGGNITLKGGTGGEGTQGGGQGGNVILQGGDPGTDGSYGYVLINTDGGRVGIGTNSPSAKLHIYSSLTYQNGVLININTTNSSYYSLDVQSGGTSRLYVRADGNIGIGTDSPSRMLEVTDNNPQLRLSYSSTDYVDFSVTSTIDSTSTLIIDSPYTGTGDVVYIGSDGTGKLTSGLLDPQYNIGGKIFATYVPSMTGIKEETTGVIKISQKSEGKDYYFAEINFNTLKEGSDLWLFSKVTNLRKNIDKLAVLLTPARNAKVWYQVDPENFKLYFFADRETVISYRLTAPRFDFEKWENYLGEGDKGMKIEEDGSLVSSSTVYQFAEENNEEGFFEKLKKYLKDALKEIGIFIEDQIAKIKEIVTEKLTANVIITDQLCIGQTCIDEAKLKELLSKNGASAVPPPSQTQTSQTQTENNQTTTSATSTSDISTTTEEENISNENSTENENAQLETPATSSETGNQENQNQEISENENLKNETEDQTIQTETQEQTEELQQTETSEIQEETQENQNINQELEQEQSTQEIIENQNETTQSEETGHTEQISTSS
jgi:hypothetical protein